MSLKLFYFNNSVALLQNDLIFAVFVLYLSSISLKYFFYFLSFTIVVCKVSLSSNNKKNKNRLSNILKHM